MCEADGNNPGADVKCFERGKSPKVLNTVYSVCGADGKCFERGNSLTILHVLLQVDCSADERGGEADGNSRPYNVTLLVV